MSNKRLTIRKVPVKTLLSILNELYTSGADFIDLHGIVNNVTKEDSITVSVPLEYMNQEYLNSLDKVEQKEEIDDDDDDDIPQLPPKETKYMTSLSEKDIIEMLKKI